MTRPTGRASGRTAIEAVGLGKRYRRRWALRDCTFRLPAGRICALTGPHGAGKTTLLALASGLLRPDEGTVRTGGGGRVAHLTQGKPLYPRLTVAETLRLGRELNPGHWSQQRAERIVREGRVPPHARVGSLSRGRHTRVALALALATNPELLLLDEPFADLDPLVRHEFAGLLLAEAAAYGTTVVLSSHALAELDGICDYLMVLGGGRVRLAGEVDDVIGAHALLVGTHHGAGLPPRIAAHTVIDTGVNGRQFTALVRPEGPLHGPWESVEPSLEEVLLGYLRAPDAPGLIAPSAEPVAPRPHGAPGKKPGNKPGIPGMPRNGPRARPRPPGAPDRTGHHHHDNGGHRPDMHHSGKGAAA